MSRLTNAKDITSANTNEVVRTYSALGRLTTETQKIGTATERSIAKEYNLVGRVNKLTYPNGRINQYTFDNNYLPSTISSNNTVVAFYQFNAVNAPTTKTLGNNVSLNIEYNNRYQNEAMDGESLAGLTCPQGCDQGCEQQITKHDWKKNGITIAGYNYGQDSVGNRIWSENLVTANKSELFAFDNADRLTSFKTGTLNGSKTSVTAPTYTQGWQLDKIENWSEFNDNGTNSINSFTDTHENEAMMAKFSWSCQPKGRVQGCTKQMTQFKGVTQTFDNNGNLIFDGIRNFKYDAFNRIIEVKVGTVVLAEYQYDAFNRRVMKKVDADLNGTFDSTVKFLYDGFRCIEELNASDALTKEFVYGSLYIDEVILQRTGATDYYFTNDYRYSVTGLTNSAGAIVESYDYKVYGERSITGSGLTDIGYTGQRHDAETGLMYFKNRYYSTSMGSFVTRDPLGYVDGMSSYLGYFGGMGRDMFGFYEEDGHFYTTYLVGIVSGMSQKDAYELAYYSQLPDEVEQFDAYSLQVGVLNQAWDDMKHFRLGMTQENIKKVKWRDKVHYFIHSLQGKKAEEYRICIKKLFLDKKVKPPLEIWERGFLIHALGDTYAHSTKNKVGEEILNKTGDGHALASGGQKYLGLDTEPDYIENDTDKYFNYETDLERVLGAYVAGSETPNTNSSLNNLFLKDKISDLIKKNKPLGNKSIKDAFSELAKSKDYGLTQEYSPLGRMNIDKNMKMPTEIEVDALIKKISDYCEKCKK